MFLCYVSRVPRTPETVAVLYAFGNLGLESVRFHDRLGSARGALSSARMSLAAAHSADPTGGDPSRVGEVVGRADTRPVFQRVLGGRPGPPLSAQARIATAAAARVQLADLIGRYAARDELREPPWPIGSGGTVSWRRECRRWRRAVLPACAGLDRETEGRRMAAEGLRFHDELRALSPDYAYLLGSVRDLLPGIRRENRS
ncbi:hypothetical protein GT354_29850 [Streptomyces sp. SID3343]|nr:hypothetical protein [Streptomyces sp. SID3343]